MHRLTRQLFRGYGRVVFRSVLILLALLASSSLADSYISEYQGSRLYAWDGRYLSKYQGSRIFEVDGSVPVVILALLAAGYL
jgi:hypothetical protein